MWKKRWMMQLGPMMAPKDPDDGEGGGGGAAFTPDQLKEMTKVINSAVTGQLGRKLKDAVSAQMNESLAPVLERLEALGTKGGDNGDGGEPPPSKTQKAAMPPEVQKRLDELERANKKLQDDNKRAQDDAAAQRKANEANEERAALAGALKRAGVSDDRVAGAAALLYHDQKKLKRDSEGNIRFVQKDAYGNTEEVDLDTGVTGWATTGEGKAYLPPVPVQGGGARGGSNNGARGGKADPSEQELLHELGNTLMGGKPTLNLT